MFNEIENLQKWNGKIIAGEPHTSGALNIVPDFGAYVAQGEKESIMPYYVALSKGVDPKILGLAKEGNKAYLQCLDPCELTKGGTVILEVGLKRSY